jgi:hypothetical protein
MANKRKLCLVRVNIFDPADTIYRFMLENIATQSINSVGGIYDNPAVRQAVNDGTQIPHLRIIRVQL